MQYTDYQNLASSEKLTLATIESAKRLMGWAVHSGSVYSIAFPYAVLVGIEDSGTPYVEVGSVGAVTASKYFLDRATNTLYLRTTGSDNPNSRFIVATTKFFFANSPVVLPHDLESGFDVEWSGQIQSTSQFGVEIDTVAQVSEAIEGSGSLTLVNDQVFWPANYDKWFFENQRVRIYSYHREMAPEDARLLFKGRVEKKSYSSTSVKFQLKDQFAELRSPISLGLIEDLELRTGSDLAKAQQRLVLGRVSGLVPVNVDQVVDGYPLTGTVSISFADATLTGSGTQFLTELSPDDEVVLDGVSYSVADVTSNTSVELTENYAEVAGLSDVVAYLNPDRPKRFINRVWKVAGHAVREPVTSIAAGSSISQIFVESAEDIYAGDWIYVGTLGSGELVQVDEVVGEATVRLVTSLETIPSIGTEVRRPAVQNVRINDTLLVYYQDYTFDADTATLTLRDTAEANSGPIRQLASGLTFTNGTRAVSGTGLKSTIFPGYMVGVVGNADFFEVLSVDSDTDLTLRSNASFSDTATGRYKSLIYNPESDTLSLDVLGKTDDGTSVGVLLKTAPAIVKALLEDTGLEDEISEASFDAAESLVPQHIGFCWPETFDGQTTISYRDVINKVNRSVFGSLVQNSEFKFSYEVLRPSKPVSTPRLMESDVLSFSTEATAENIVKTCIVQYQPKEYDYLTGDQSIQTSQKTSDVANHILKTTREKTFVTYLVEQQDAMLHSHRWAFLLERATGRVNFTTKLRGATFEVGDIVDVQHRKFFDRLGGSDRRKLMLVEGVKKSGTDVSVEATDLSNAFNRVACFTSATDEYSDASEDDLLYSGYFTDDYGLIDNEPESHGSNLFW